MGKKRPESKIDDHFYLDWFIPTEDQKKIIESMDDHDLTIVKAPSGCGKSATVLWKALKEYRVRNFNKIIIIKNPTEAGDDKIGYLTGDSTQKLSYHMDSMKSLFYQFISKNKLENDVSNENIVFDIPNFLLGKTLDNSIIILEEAQTMSPNTIKLCIERAGVDSIVVVVGDSAQAYSVKSRNDGLADLIGRMTVERFGGEVDSRYPEMVGYVEMSHDNNMRSDLSHLITKVYDAGHNG